MDAVVSCQVDSGFEWKLCDDVALGRNPLYGYG